MSRLKRKLVKIDEEKCDGCGLCVPNCAEGALRIVDGKAKLQAENLCDGLGACLGHCPQDAITVEEIDAEAFDEQAVSRHLAGGGVSTAGHVAEAAHLSLVAHSPHATHVAAASHVPHAGGCPGSRLRVLGPQAPAARSGPVGGEAPVSRLGHWPVQLALLPVQGRMWDNADVLIAADCVPFAYAGFHEKMLTGRSVAIGCPKLDDVENYVHKLTAIFSGNAIRSVKVARMEVPCCGGIVRAVRLAMAASGRDDIPIDEVVVGVDGQLRGG